MKPTPISFPKRGHGDMIHVLATHIEDKPTMGGSDTITLSTALGPFHYSHVLPYMKETGGTFLGPAYLAQDGHITDTQICVTGTVEDEDEAPEVTAAREIMEEIGKRPSDIIFIKSTTVRNKKGHSTTWSLFYAKV